MSRELTTADLDALFSAARKYRSTATVTATRADRDDRWTTSGGDELSIQAGDWWVSSGDGDRWSVRADVFAATYECLGGDRYRKVALVEAVPAPGPVRVATLEGEASAADGDWLLRNPSGEVWPVPAAVFSARYAAA